jgi:rare lipoprotein A
MVIRRRSGARCLNAPLRIWLLAGIPSAVLAVVVVCIATRPVQAHVLVPPPAASVPPSVPVVVRTAPESLTPGRTIAAQRKALLRGIASWYGEAFDGRTTASGERYDMYAMTACHPTLPFGSLVRVVNLKNGRSVVVRITDRGDLPDGRIVDLSFAAAEKLAMTDSGLAPVRLDVLSRGPHKG